MSITESLKSIYTPSYLEQQVASTWNTLDKLAQESPEDYDNFVRSVTGLSAPIYPEPGFVFETVLKRKEGGIVAEQWSYFVNVCHHCEMQSPYCKKTGSPVTRVEDLTTASWSISVGARRYQPKHRRVVTDVVVHPLIVARSRFDSAFRHFLAFCVLEKLKLRETAQAIQSRQQEIRLSPVYQTEVDFDMKSIDFPKLRYKSGTKPQKHDFERGCSSEKEKPPAVEKKTENPPEKVLLPPASHPCIAPAESSCFSGNPLIEEIGEEESPAILKVQNVVPEVCPEAVKSVTLNTRDTCEFSISFHRPNNQITLEDFDILIDPKNGLLIITLTFAPLRDSKLKLKTPERLARPKIGSRSFRDYQLRITLVDE